MQSMSVARYGHTSAETGIFNRIAMFSAMGLGMWVVLVVGYGFHVVAPWF